MDPAKQLVTVWNVTVREVVSQLVSKCSESGSVESAIENRFNRQCQTNVTRLPFFLFFFPLNWMAGKVETDLRESFCLQKSKRNLSPVYY